MASSANVPFSAISRAARMKPAQAVRASEPPDADTAYAEILGFLHRKPGSTDQKIDGFGMHGFDDGCDLVLCLDARRIKAIRARFRVSGQPVDHQLQIGPAPQERLAAPGQKHAACVHIDRGHAPP